MVTIRQAVNRTGVSAVTIQRYIASGKIQAKMIDGMHNIPEEELTKLPKPRTRHMHSQQIAEKVEVPKVPPFPIDSPSSTTVQLEKIRLMNRIVDLLEVS